MIRHPLLSAAAVTLVLSATAVSAQTPPSAPPAEGQTVPPATPPGASRGGGMMALMPPRTTDEVAPWADRLFTMLDANQDAAITGDEMGLLTRPEIASRGGGRLRAMISQSDSSRDARVSREELAAGAARMFTRMDANGDGRLADEELPQPPAPPRPMSIPMPTPAPMPMPMPPPPEG